MAANPPTKMACRTTLTEMLSTVCQVFQESMVRKTFYIFNFCELNFVILLGCNYAYNDVDIELNLYQNNVVWTAKRQ